MDRRSFADYPRRLQVEASTDVQHFSTVYDGTALPALAASLIDRPAEPGIDIALRGTEARVLRLRQTGRTPARWFWSVHEVRLWEARPRSLHVSERSQTLDATRHTPS
jgi:hypothetical protein